MHEAVLFTLSMVAGVYSLAVILHGTPAGQCRQLNMKMQEEYEKAVASREERNDPGEPPIPPPPVWITIG